MENTIGNDAIKIACIQCIPGYEWEVQSQFDNFCCKSEAIIDHAFLKGLGSFDIILIYRTRDFEGKLRELGIIKGILKSNLLLCYPFSNKPIDTLFNDVKSNTFSAFYLLKINPRLKVNNPSIENGLRSFLANKSQLSLLGSIGWSELVLVLSTNDIKDIYKHILRTGYIYLDIDSEKYSVILKTLTFIGINYNTLPPYSILKRGIRATRKYMRISGYFNHPIQMNNGNSNCPSIEVSTKTTHLPSIEKYFTPKKFNISYSAGKFDIVARPSDPDMELSDFISVLIYFRYKFRNKIFSTMTRSIFYDKYDTGINYKESNLKALPFDLNYPEFELYFGPAMASNLSTLIYTLNSLHQNPLSGNLYNNMMRYPEYVRGVGKLSHEEKQDNRSFALVAGHAIRRGAELRSYGTYDTIEEVTGRFSEFKGGCQVSLVAMEILPSLVLNSINHDWYGFVTVSGDPQFSHFQEVLNVTPSSLWNPQEWWALYHEIAHIIIEREVDLVSENVDEVAQYLVNRPLSSIDDIIELSAEVIGFELGLFGDFELYFKLLWKYLLDLDPYHNNPLSTYAVRTFFIELFNGHFRTHTNIPKITKSDFDLDSLYENFISHMTKIENFLGREIFPDKCFIAAQNVKDLRDLYPFCQHLSQKMLGLSLRPRKSQLESKNTQIVFKHINGGKIWWGEIESPQAILYHLFCSTHVNFNTKIATILSFWNQNSTTS